MVTILPENPGFGATFARGLGGGFSQGLNRGIDQAGQFAQAMALQKAKSNEKNAFYETLFGGNKMQSEDGMGSLMAGRLSPEQETMLALEHPPAFAAYKNLQGMREKEDEKVKQHEEVGTVLNSLADTLAKGNLGYTPARYLKAEGRRDAQYYDSLAVQLESIAKEMVSKGVLAKDRFAYLIGNLPSADKTDAENAGAIEAWSDNLGVERPLGLEKHYEKGKEVEKKGSTEKKQVSKMPVFDAANPKHKKVRDALMKKYKNNREKVAAELSKHFREE